MAREETMTESGRLEFNQELATDLVKRAIQDAKFNLSLQGGAPSG